MLEESNKRGAPKARGNGDGTLYQLASGRWAWQITYEEFGKIKRRSGSNDDKTQAKRALDQARRDRELGLLSNADRITVNELASMWLEGQTDMGTRASKMGRDEVSYVLEIIGPMKVKDVQRNMLEKAIRALMTRPMGRRDENGKPPENATPMSHRTVGKSLMRLKALFEYAVICKIRHDDPSLGLKRPKSKTLQAETVGTVLDIDEKARFHEIGSALLNRSEGLNLLRRQRPQARGETLTCPRVFGRCSRRTRHTKSSSKRKPGVHGVTRARSSLRLWVGGSARTT